MARAHRFVALLAVLGAAALRPALVRGQEQAGTPVVDSIEVEGISRNTRETVINAAALAVHTAVGYRDLQRAIRAVYATGQFDDVTIGRRSGADGSEILVISVRERPLLVRATVRGVEKLSERSVSDRIELPAGRPVNPGLVERGRQRIDSLYEAEGYYLADVRAVTVPQDSGRVRIVYEIEEGRRVAIARVEFEGNQRFRASEIAKHLRTRPEGFWWFQKGEYSEDRLREDIEQRLPQFYGSRGFVDFRVLDDTLVVDQDNGKATLRITLEEGQQYRVGRVRVEGNRRFSTEEVLSLNPFGGSDSSAACGTEGCASSGGWFDQTRWENATNRLRTQYWNQGYIYAQIEPRVERVEAGDSLPEPRVDLAWMIEEGRPAIVNRVEIVGNNVTHERVIRDAIVILPGDVFSQDRVLRSYQNVGNLGYFQQPLPFPDTRPANDEGDIDLVFRVAERNTGNVNFGASVGQGTGVGGFLGFDQPNLFGLGKRTVLQWQFGRNINDFTLSYTDPQVLGSRISTTVGLHNTRIRYTVADLGRIQTRGGSLQMGWPLPRSRYSRLFTSYSLESESYSGAARTMSGVYRCASCLRSTFGLSFMRDTRIELPFATGGAYYEAGTQFTGGVLGGEGAFQRVDLDGKWYAPLGQVGGSGPAGSGVRVVLSLAVKSGFVFGNVGPFFRQLFAMGGTQYGIPLRGYDEFSITPSGFDPSGSASYVSPSAFGKSYLAATTELGFRVSQMIYFGLFVDAGNVWANAAGFNPSRLYRGAGVGVSLITPMGPMGIDYAYGFDRLGTDGLPRPGWKLHFKIGNFF